MPRKYELTLSPDADTDVPDGDGYHFYNELLADTNARFETLSVSMLMDGPFNTGEAPHTKRIFGDADYTLRLSVTSDDEGEELERLLAPHTGGDEPLVIDGTELPVTSFERTTESMGDLWTYASYLVSSNSTPEVSMTFNTPTCVVHPRSTVTEMFPHRRSIFPQLAGAWNRALETNGYAYDSDLKLALAPFDVGAKVFEKPDTRSYRTFSTLTDIRTDEEGEPMPFFRQGYIGTCAYGFRRAESELQETVAALALFAEYNGVGVDTHHGCGCVSTAINGQTNER